MKKSLTYSVAASALLLGAVIAGPAAADVQVLANITKTKDTRVVETITITKTATILVNAAYILNGTAETTAIANITNSGHFVTGTDLLPGVGDTEHDDGNEVHARIVDSFGGAGLVLGNTGVVGFNQSAGNFANQGNIVSVGIIADDAEAFANAQAHTDQRNTGNTVFADEGVCAPGTGDECAIFDEGLPGALYFRKTAKIENSINGNTGILDANQDAGNVNNQTNTDAISVALGGVLALAEGDLGQVNANNLVQEAETVRQNVIVGSINTNSGIVKINQASGNMNNQANNVAFAALTVQATITPPTAFTRF